MIQIKFWSRYDLQNFRKRNFLGDDQVVAAWLPLSFSRNKLRLGLPEPRIEGFEPCIDGGFRAKSGWLVHGKTARKFENLHHTEYVYTACVRTHSVLLIVCTKVTKF